MNTNEHRLFRRRNDWIPTKALRAQMKLATNDTNTTNELRTNRIHLRWMGLATNEHKRTQKIFRKRNVVSRKGIKNTKVVGHRLHRLTQIIPQAECWFPTKKVSHEWHEYHEWIKNELNSPAVNGLYAPACR